MYERYQGRLGAASFSSRTRTDHENDYKLLTDIRAAKCGLTDLKLAHKRCKEQEHMKLLNSMRKGQSVSQVCVV